MNGNSAVARRVAGGAPALVTVGVAMVIFALCAHRGWPWIILSAVGLLGAAVLIGASLRESPWPWALLGSAASPSRVVLVASVGIVVGIVGGAFQRHYSGAVAANAGEPHLFVVVACLIGATEELVYRGWMLERLTRLGALAAVVISAVAHGAYKTALFAWPPSAEGAGLNLAGVALWTVLGGTVLGLLRVWARNVLPPVLAHVAFDAVVYSGFVASPWWVWG